MELRNCLPALAISADKNKKNPVQLDTETKAAQSLSFDARERRNTARHSRGGQGLEGEDRKYYSGHPPSGRQPEYPSPWDVNLEHLEG